MVRFGFAQGTFLARPRRRPGACRRGDRQCGALRPAAEQADAGGSPNLPPVPRGRTGSQARCCGHPGSRAAGPRGRPAHAGTSPSGLPLHAWRGARDRRVAPFTTATTARATTRTRGCSPPRCSRRSSPVSARISTIRRSPDEPSGLRQAQPLSRSRRPFSRLPVPRLLGLALVVDLLALGQRDLDLGAAAVVEIKPKWHDSSSLRAAPHRRAVPSDACAATACDGASARG